MQVYSPQAIFAYIFVGKDIALAQDCGSSKSNNIINSDNNNLKSTDEHVGCLGDTVPTVQQLTCSDVEPDDEQPDQQHCDEHSLKNESAAVPIVRFYGRQHKKPVRYR